MARHLQAELDNLKKELLHIASMVENATEKALVALLERRAELAQEVIDEDDYINDKEVRIEEECLKILALHQPVANDLRFIVSVLKINNDLERIADMAVNIAERVLDLTNYEQLPVPFEFATMSQKVYAMVKKSLDALVNLDPDLAREVTALDDEVDDLHHNSYGMVIERIQQNPAQIEALICYLVVSRYLERIADLATNIAEDTLYLIEGEIVRHILC